MATTRTFATMTNQKPAVKKPLKEPTGVGSGGVWGKMLMKPAKGTK